MADLSLDVTYLGHSGFYLELPTATLLFDWYQGDLPAIRGNVPMYIFISHIHADHFRQEVFPIAARLNHAEIFLGYDYSNPDMDAYIDSLPEKLSDALCCFDGEQRLYSDDGKVLVRSLQSTDKGVAFLVEIEGKTIFHAGDLFLMQTASQSEYMDWYTDMLMKHPGASLESYNTYLSNREKEFIGHTEPLRGMNIDFGMLPLDPRYGDVGYRTVEGYMQTAKFKYWAPMHLWGKYEYVDSFVSKYPEYAANMAGPTKMDGAGLATAVGQKYRLNI